MRIRSWLPAAIAVAAVTGASAPIAAADTPVPAHGGAPFTVEDGAYPYSALMQAATGAELIAGDGNITYISCSGDYQIMVWARNLLTSESRICFKAASTGYLKVNVPRAYRLETNDRDIAASISIEGSTQNLTVPKDTTKGFGEANTNDPKQAVLLEMRVTGSSAPVPPPAPGDNPQAYLGKLKIGNTRSCTAALVDPRWVVTAKSCFADKPGESINVAAGAPKEKSNVTLGRADLATSGGHTSDIAELVPHTDRDLVMARLSTPTFAISPVALSSAAPAAGQDLTVVSYGRTRDSWAPTTARTATYTTGAAAAHGFDITAKAPTDAILCKGDAGAPALRTENGKPALVAVISRAWQNDCFDGGVTDKAGAYTTRIDDLGQWIGNLLARRSAAVNEAGGNGRIRWADWDGDGKPDYINVADNGNVEVYLNRGGDGRGGWEGLGKVALGTTSDRNRVRFADWDGDGKTDYLVIHTDGSVEAFLNRGGDGRGGWNGIGKIARGVTNDASKVRFADWDGDGRTDYLVFNDGGAVTAYLNRGGDVVPHTGWHVLGQITTGSTSDRARVRFADSDGDGRADYFIVKPDGKVDLYLNRGGDVVPNTGWQVIGQIATGLTTDHTRVQFVDFNADTHADYVLGGPNNSAVVYAWNGGDRGNGWTDLGKVASGT
ncbi:FG-GAP-like repeat-containing protein [Streptomyces xanthophaeus]